MKRRFDDIQLGSIELFCLASEAGSFTAAALDAGITPAAVSRSILRLEARLGVRLFVRTTRSIRLTEAGRTYFEQCRQALSQLIEAEREVMGKQLVPAGTLRISVPTTYGHYRILPLLPLFRERYSEVKVDIHLSNRNIDFVSEGYDMAIRVRAQPDSGLIARHLEDAELVVVATQKYLDSAGTPVHPKELTTFDCIQFELPSSGRKIPWLFRDKDKPIEILTEGGYCFSEDILGGITLVKQHAGLFQTYRLIVEKELASGELVEVLQQYQGSFRPFTIFYPHKKHVPLRLRAFIDFLMEHRRTWSKV